MAIERRCDLTDARIDGHDAGARPTLATTSEGLVFRIELVEWTGASRPNLHPHALRRALPTATLAPEPRTAPADDDVPMQLRARRSS